jgi:hypothetical protein
LSLLACEIGDRISPYYYLVPKGICGWDGMSLVLVGWAVQLVSILLFLSVGWFFCLCNLSVLRALFGCCILVFRSSSSIHQFDRQPFAVGKYIE